jgi:peptidoglycan L-alanyl-D-glutamate endopeptidase CwlK
VIQSRRTIEEQAALYAQGRTAPGSIVTRAQPGFSWHNYGLAFDAAPFSDDGQPDWRNDLKFALMGQAGIAAGLEWGGAWQHFPDRPHFQARFGLQLTDLVCVGGDMTPLGLALASDPDTLIPTKVS